jgi:hypothetical protein
MGCLLGEEKERKSPKKKKTMGSGVLHDRFVYTSQADAIAAGLATDVALVVGERMGVRVVCNTRELERELNERKVSGVQYAQGEDDGALRVKVDSTPPVEWVVRVNTVPPVTKPQRPAPLALPPIPTSDDKAEALRYFDAVMGLSADHVFSALRDSIAFRASILYQENVKSKFYDFVEKLCHIHALEAQCVFVGWLQQELLMVGRVIDDAVSVLRKRFDTLSLASWSYLPLTMEGILRRLQRVESLYHFLVTSKEVSGLLGAKGISGLQSTLSRISGRVTPVCKDVERVWGIYESAVPVMDNLWSLLGMKRLATHRFLSAVPLLLRNATRREAAILDIERILNTEPDKTLLTEKEVDEITELLERSAVAGIHFKISDLSPKTQKAGLLEQLRVHEEFAAEPTAENLIKTLQKVVDSRGVEDTLILDTDTAWRKARVELPNGETIVGNRLYKDGEYTVGIWVSWRMFVCWVELPQGLSSTGKCSWLVFYVMQNQTAVQRGYEIDYRGASNHAVVPTEESVKGAGAVGFEVFKCEVLIQPDDWNAEAEVVIPETPDTQAALGRSYALMRAICLMLIYSAKTGVSWVAFLPQTRYNWFLRWAKRESASELNPDSVAASMAASALAGASPHVAFAQSGSDSFWLAMEVATGIKNIKGTVTETSVRTWVLNPETVREFEELEALRRAVTPSLMGPRSVDEVSELASPYASSYDYWNGVSRPVKVALHTVSLTHNQISMHLTVTSVEVPPSDGEEPVVVIDTVTITPQSGSISALIDDLNVDTPGNRKLLDMIELGNSLTLPPKPIPTIDPTDDKAKAVKYFDAVMGRLVDHFYSAVRAYISDDATPPQSGVPEDREESSYGLVRNLCAVAALDTGVFSLGWIVQELHMFGAAIDDAVSVLRQSFDDLNLESWSYGTREKEHRLVRVESLYQTLIKSEEVSVLLGAEGIRGLQSTLDRMSDVKRVTFFVEQREVIYDSVVPVMTQLSKELCIQPLDAQAPPFQTPHFLSVVPHLLRNAPQRKATGKIIRTILNGSSLTESDVSRIKELLASSAAVGINFPISNLLENSIHNDSLLLDELKIYDGGLVPDLTEPVAENVRKTLQKVVDKRGFKL